MLPPVPRGYIASRLHALAEGSCLADFNWNSGGSWQGKPWTTELLTDSALVFYLFAAFLKVVAMSVFLFSDAVWIAFSPKRECNQHGLLLAIQIERTIIEEHLRSSPALQRRYPLQSVINCAASDVLRKRTALSNCTPSPLISTKPEDPA